MSGIEVASLVLGAFPLIILALEHYHGLRRGLQVQRAYRMTISRVKDEQLSLRLSLERLLSPLCAGDNFGDGEIEELLADPNGPKWSERKVDTFVAERLGLAHDRFMEVAESMHTTLSKLLVSLVDDKPQLQASIRTELEAEVARTGSHTSKLSKNAFEKFEEFVKQQVQYRKEQLEFGLGRRMREEMVQELHRNNEMLDKLLEKSEKILTTQSASALPISPDAVKSLVQYSKHANQIYSSMSKSWECTCRNEHCAHLWLQHRRTPTFEMRFLVVFGSKNSPLTELPPWDRQGIRITWEEAGLQRAVIDSQKAVQTLKACSPALHVLRDPSATKRKRVKFGLTFSLEPSIPPQLSSPSARSRPKGKELIRKPSNQSADKLSDISKLCQAMSTCGMQPTLIGSFSSDHAGKVYSVRSEPEQKIAGDALSLEAILQGADVSMPRLSDRFRIALALASSHLQLRSTPWARRQWEARDIQFPKDPKGEPLYGKPYVSASFTEVVPSTEMVPKSSDRSFACLGIMLLEIFFVKQLEHHWLWKEFGGPGKSKSNFYRLLVARQWADDASGDSAPSFAAAVSWCLNESPTSLAGETWRKDLARRVVLPLERCCDHFLSAP